MSKRSLQILNKITGRQHKARDRHAEREDIVQNPNDLQVHASLLILVKDIGAVLDKQYPGWGWVIQPDQRGMIINVFNMHCSDEWGFTIRTVEIHNSPSAAKKMAQRAGREILERFGIRPGPYRSELLLGKKRDHNGRLIPVDAWDRMTRQQKEQQRVREGVDELQKIVIANGK